LCVLNLWTFLQIPTNSDELIHTFVAKASYFNNILYYNYAPELRIVLKRDSVDARPPSAEYRPSCGDEPERGTSHTLLIASTKIRLLTVSTVDLKNARSRCGHVITKRHRPPTCLERRTLPISAESYRALRDIRDPNPVPPLAVPPTFTATGGGNLHRSYNTLSRYKKAVISQANSPLLRLFLRQPDRVHSVR